MDKPCIVQRSKWLKDFIDVYFLIQHLTMAEMEGYNEKK